MSNRVEEINVTYYELIKKEASSLSYSLGSFISQWRRWVKHLGEEKPFCF